MQYRFLHVLEYHLPGHQSHHHSNEIPHECNHDEEPQGESQFKQIIELCPVVDYEFAISDQPAIYYSTPKPDIRPVTNCDYYPTLINSFPGTQKQLRAPPLL
jgi:hypothetical protein